MKSPRPLTLVLLLAALLTFESARADDWSVRRSPFDPRVVARYKALLNRRPNDGYALRKLLSLYRRHRSLKALIGEYRALARAKPKSFAYQVILGHLQRRAGNAEEATRRYEKAAGLNPRSPTVPAALAALYRKQGRTEDAKKAYSRALSLAVSQREKKRYLRALATLALATGDLAAARRHFDGLVAMEPKNLLVRIELAQALAKSGHDKEAIAQYRTILGKTSDSARKADVLKEIGALLQKQSKDDEAVATYRRAMKLTAQGHWLRRELTERVISIYRQREDLGSLIQHYEKTWKRRGHFEHDLLGRLYDETGDETRALKSYRAALKAAPHAVDTRVRLIALLERTGRDGAVIDEYRRLARIAPGEPRYQLELAKRLHRAGKRGEAFRILDRCGGRFPGDASVHSALADLYARWGEQKRAMRAAQVLVRIEPRDPSHLVNLGEQHYLRGNKRKAVETWRRLLGVIPKRHAALAKLAEIYGQHDMTKEAIALFRKAIKLQPRHMPYHRALALLLERKRITVDALRSWNKVLELAKGNNARAASKEARSHIIDILHRSYQLRRRIREYSMAFDGPQPSIDAGFMLAEAHLKLGNMEEAEKAYVRILAVDEKNTEAMTALESVYRRQRKLAKAVTLLKKLAVLQPSMAREHYQRIADLLLQLYNDEEALVYAHKAVAMGKRDARSFQRLGELYEKKEDYDNAMSAYRQAIKLAPNRFQVHFALARLHTQRGDYEAAEKLYRQVLRRAKAPEVLRKAFRTGIELSEYLGGLKRLEKELLPLSVLSMNAETYRRLLVQIYRRRVPVLIDRARQGSSETRDAAREELRRIGIRGLAPLLDELASASSGKKELVRMLGYLGNANAVVPLLRIASQEPEEEVVTIRGSGPYYRGGVGLGASHLIRQVNLRVEATVAVGRIADRRAVGGLVQLLADREGPIRDAAAWALSRIDSPKSTRALFSALGDPRASVQMMACAGLGLHGGREMAPVVEEVMLDRTREERVRAACAWGLGTAGARRSVPALTSVLGSSEDQLQRCAVWSLGVLGATEALPALVRSLWSKRRGIRGAVLWSIARIAAGKAVPRPGLTPDVAVKEGKLDSEAFAASLTEAISTMPGRDLARGLGRVVEAHRRALSEGLRTALLRHRDVVLRVLADLDSDPARLSLGPLSAGRTLLSPSARQRLDHAVHAVCTPLRPRLVQLVAHRDPLVRERAISVLAKLAPEDAETQLRRGLADRSWSVRSRALSGLELAHRRGSVPRAAAERMIVASLAASHWRERESAARVAGRLGYRSLAPALAKRIGDTNGFVREAATVALGHTGGPAALPALRRALGDEAPHVRAAACTALSRLGPPGLSGWLAPLTRDASLLVRAAARSALR